MWAIPPRFRFSGVGFVCREEESGWSNSGRCLFAFSVNNRKRSEVLLYLVVTVKSAIFRISAHNCRVP